MLKLAILNLMKFDRDGKMTLDEEYIRFIKVLVEDGGECANVLRNEQ